MAAESSTAGCLVRAASTIHVSLPLRYTPTSVNGGLLTAVQ